jgi:tripartite-type tricarboxylate transporter receptor subunit TctC
VQKYHAALSVAAGVLLALAPSGQVAAQNTYPTKPVRMIVPFAPGGGVSAVARLVGPKLTEIWGQQVVIDNRPGGNTVIGTETLVRSPADGYTLIWVSSAHVINHALLPNLPYHALNDFAPVSSTSSGPYVMVTHASLPTNNLQEFIAFAKAKPGQLNYSTSGSGGVQHLAGELFNTIAGIKTQHVPYKGAGPAVIELLGAQVQYSFQPPGNVVVHVRNGKLKAIAAPSQTRLTAFPQLPTFAEQGMPGFEVKSWIGILAPAKTPKPLVQKIAADVATVIKQADTRDKLLKQEHEPMLLGPDEFTAFMKSEAARVANIVKAANIKIEHSM